jgi:hypothetical protein
VKPLHKAAGVGTVLAALIAWLLWELAPLRPVQAVAALSDPAKLATLGERGANSRLNKIIYWLHECEGRGLSADSAVRWAQRLNQTHEPRASLVRESLSRNMRIAGELGLFTAENLDRLRHGKAGIVTKGPYTGSPVEVDHIVPYSTARELGNELANLELLPEPLNRRKSNQVGERQWSHAQRLFEAGLLSKESMSRLETLRLRMDNR